MVKKLCPDMSLHFVEDDSYDITLRRDAAEGDPVEYGLYLVTLTRKRRSDTVTLLTPSTTMHYVLAESEEGAIDQVSDSPFNSHVERYTAEENGDLTGTAVRVPLHIRGWGLRTF